MLVVEPKQLLKKLNTVCTRALEAGASACISSRHYEVTVEHILLALFDDFESDVVAILQHYKVDPANSRASLQRSLSDLRSGNAGKPVFSPLLFEWIQDAWIYSSTELNESMVRSGSLFVRLVQSPTRYLPAEMPMLERFPRDTLRSDLLTITSGTKEASEAAQARASSSGGGGVAGVAGAGGKTTGLGKADGPLQKFTTDLTERARKGEIDPVFGREQEIRQVVDILVRRRKNNPIVVGEAGVGKTALVEGLAVRIAEGTVPDSLKDVSLLALDLGALQAGAGVKGEFENRLKGVINEVKASPKPIVMFIDEAHTIIGAGGAGGGSGDAANLLKPALARGELRTVAATTWSEYKKYFEKDAALERRFQPVKVEEPSVDNAILMLRGLADRFEKSHGIIIQDEAVRAAVTLSAKYISGRLLPDKSVDLLDTAAARAKVQKAAPPAIIEDTKAELAGVDRELAAMERDHKAGLALDDERQGKLKKKHAELTAILTEAEQRHKDQMAIVNRIDELRKDDKNKDELRAEINKLKAIKADQLLVHADVDESLIASIVGDWTGIPVGKMVKDDVEQILNMEAVLNKRVRGQDPALKAISRELRAARSGLKPTTAPLGVFMLVGPSGVGKTETALALADLLFGGERFIVTINMSEFQEKHTVSRLIGSPPGYVGFGEGGMLTEAVRQRPYSVVLLDECEKADKDVMNLFYQVFDKGMLSDGEGRVIDFKNTVIIMTSNLATDLITNAAPPGGEIPPLDEITSLVKPVLSAHFKPALLARMTVVPYIPIGPEALNGIVRMKLGSVVKRAKESQNVDLVVDDKVYDAIAARCREVESGARNVDHILRGTVMPLVSQAILANMAEGNPTNKMYLSVDKGGDIVCNQGAPA